MLSVVIAGGGIAGLSAATALRRAGHAVTVVERHDAASAEVGAAIMIPSNASRPLLAWGLDPVRARMVEARSVVRVPGCDGKAAAGQAEGEDLSRWSDKFVGPWLLSHRVDLHVELMKLAVDQGEEAGPGTVDIRSGCEVVAYDSHAPSVTLADGTVVPADVVIVAEGVHSGGAEAVTGQPNRPLSQSIYNFCYRFLITAADLEADAATRWWTEDDDGRVKMYIGDQKRIVSYAVRDGEVHNFVAMFHNEDGSSMMAEDFHAPADKSKLLSRFADFHPRIRAVLAKATEITQWPLLYRAPLPSWTRSHLALAGDAAHPMLPHQGQGAAQAIEDAVALGIVLCGAKSRHDVPARLAAYEAVRRTRASVLQVLSNAGQDEPAVTRREAARFMPLEDLPRTLPDFHRFCHGYDVVAEAVRAMNGFDSSFCLPRDFFQFPARGGYDWSR